LSRMSNPESSGSFINRPMEDLKYIIESLLFVADEPLNIDRFRNILGRESAQEIRAALNALAEEYEARKGGFDLREVAGGFQIRSRPEYNDWIKRLVQPNPVRLSKAALETLAIIAYKQPIIRSDIEHIRGVDCGGILRMLLERKLIRVLGRKEIPGRPIIYATTRHFLEVFELKDLKDLPTPREIEALGNSEPEGLTQQLETPDATQETDAETGEEPEPGETAVEAGVESESGETVAEAGEEPEPGETVAEAGEEPEPGETDAEAGEEPESEETDTEAGEDPESEETDAETGEEPESGETAAEAGEEPESWETAAEPNEEPAPETTRQPTTTEREASDEASGEAADSETADQELEDHAGLRSIGETFVDEEDAGTTEQGPTENNETD
jgi:segregation and condensation protein B